jgi:thermitase
MAGPRKRGTPNRSSMNRNNIWVHVSLAVVLVTIAAVIGQIDRWRSSLKTPLVQRVSVTNLKLNPIKTKGSNGDPEVLVRFKPGTTLDMIRALALRNHDQVADDIESVNGLVAIDDLDDADPQMVANQYAAMSNVSYAEPNTVIQLDDPATGDKSVDRDANTYEAGLPNDPQFADQWALHNQGQEGGKERADIDALKAWAKTHGSNNVVVAVLDSGVDYNHVDLRANIWTRPDIVPEYVDDELGAVDDIHGFDVDMDLGDPMDDNGHGTHCAGVIGAEADNG